MTVVRVNLDQAAIAAFGRSHEFDKVLDRIGEQIAEDAAEAAPKRTGEGAASIHHEVGEDGDGPYVRISWDADHWYMLFAEIGTSKEAPRPFLRPALEKRRTV